MINADMNSFLESINYGEEVDILYKNSKYLIGGYYDEDKSAHLYVLRYEENGKDVHEIIYETSSQNKIKDCADKFLKEKIWEGKGFWDVEREMEWID